jgi:hypothetical protein
LTAQHQDGAMRPDIIAPDRRRRRIFTARAAARGGVVCQQVKAAEPDPGRDGFREAPERRGARAVETAGLS